jgi:hypothetical protein
MRWSRCKIRAGVLAALLVPTLAIILASRSQAQFPNPGGPRIPTMPKIPTMPNGIGGGAFNPGGPKFPTMPNIPTAPKFNDPFGPGAGIGGNGIGGGIGGSRITKSWKCSGCGAHLGTGDHPPGTCPGCNARIVNGFGPANGAGNGGGGMVNLPGNLPQPGGGFIPPNLPPTQPPVMAPNQQPQPNLDPAPGPEINAVADEGQIVEGPVAPQPAVDNAEAGAMSLMAKIMIGLFAGLFGFAMIAGGIFLAIR